MSHKGEGQNGGPIHSQGCRLLGRLFTAWGEGPKPSVLMLHGLPGIELNFDIALELRDHGWNCLIMHYRGCGGSDGSYDIRKLPDDATAAVDELASGRHPQVDPERIVLIGHSMGGWAALQTASSDPRVKALAVLGAPSDPRSLPFDNLESAREITDFLQGITPEGFISQWRALEALPSCLNLVGRIAPRPLLIIHGVADAVVPLAQAKALYQRAGEPRELVTHTVANHDFSKHRPWLRAFLLSWLSGLETQTGSKQKEFS